MTKKEFILSAESAEYFTYLAKNKYIDAQLCLEICTSTSSKELLKLIYSIYDLNKLNISKMWYVINHRDCYNDIRVKDGISLNEYQIRFFKRLIECRGSVLKTNAFNNLLYNNNLLDKHSKRLGNILEEKNTSYDGYVITLKLTDGWHVVYMIDVVFYLEALNEF